MGFFERIRRGFLKIKTKLIVYLILVIIIIAVLISTLAVAFVDAKKASGVNFESNYNDAFNQEFWSVMITQVGEGIVKPLEQLGKCFTPDYIGTFWNMTKVTFGIFALFALIGLAKAIPSHEYEDIENGSSDWCEGGEQYKVLNKHKGIVLAEKNYLPVDKRGNVNVLVVRRFWSW